ncbi:MAG: serine hydrolase [Clostridia bacterium]|nr:serine hydrolase [Clostridia bacterium]
MRRISPAQAGVNKRHLQQLFDRFKKNGINLHSVLMARGDGLFLEHYWKPFTARTPHRMYSVTKSFVSVAVGQLAAEGKLGLDDPIIRYFPDKLPAVVPPELQKQTIRHMLMMCTCFADINWFQPGVTDRTAFYFAQKPVKPSGTLFHYDSTGSYILSVLVERVSGMPFMDYLRRIALDRIGGFENAQMLETPDGTPWGDSALIATPRALMNFARLVMHKGQWEGKQLLDADYLTLATTKRTDNNMENKLHYNSCGYGYQFWMTYRGGFSFNGMGSQFAICVPDKDFVFVCTGDNQLAAEKMNALIFDSVFECIVDHMTDEPLPEEGPFELSETGLPVALGETSSAFTDEINGRWFECMDNPMQISRFRLDFDGMGKGVFTYINPQGEKRLPFGMGENEMGFFPQLGYSDWRGNVHEITGFRYCCAASAAWAEPQTLRLNVWIIDRYFGQLVISFGFADTDTVGVRMVKKAEDFLTEYEGWMTAYSPKQEDGQ